MIKKDLGKFILAVSSAPCQNREQRYALVNLIFLPIRAVEGNTGVSLFRDRYECVSVLMCVARGVIEVP